MQGVAARLKTLISLCYIEEGAIILLRPRRLPA